jgi:hypothetical protein
MQPGAAISTGANFQRLSDAMRGAFPLRAANAGNAVPLPDDWREVPRSGAGIFNRIRSLFRSGRGENHDGVKNHRCMCCTSKS